MLTPAFVKVRLYTCSLHGAYPQCEGRVVLYGTAPDTEKLSEIFMCGSLGECPYKAQTGELEAFTRVNVKS